MESGYEIKDEDLNAPFGPGKIEQSECNMEQIEDTADNDNTSTNFEDGFIKSNIASPAAVHKHTFKSNLGSLGRKVVPCVDKKDFQFSIGMSKPV